jgi:hypothetical protein
MIEDWGIETGEWRKRLCHQGSSAIFVSWVEVGKKSVYLLFWPGMERCTTNKILNYCHQTRALCQIFWSCERPSWCKSVNRRHSDCTNWITNSGSKNSSDKWRDSSPVRTLPFPWPDSSPVRTRPFPWPDRSPVRTRPFPSEFFPFRYSLIVLPFIVVRSETLIR